jgi:hypothetical protein
MPPPTKLTEPSMSDNSKQENNGDGMADAGAAIAIISIVVTTLYIWLSGMPS